MIASLALKSLRDRKFTAALTVLSITLAVVLLLGVERIREEAREGFASTLSGTDLIVGARSSPVHLMLASVFRIGNATNNVRWDTYRTLAQRPEVAWTIPISLGDSHRGYRVMGTTRDYFEHFRFGRDRRLELAQGGPLDGTHDAVLGADVAQALGYTVGSSIVVAHGAGDVSFMLHEDQPFKVVGVLARTGTPVDRTVHVTLEGLDAVHADSNRETAYDPLAAAMHEDEHDAHGREEAGGHDEHEHEESAHGHAADSNRTITAFLVGLKSRGAALALQRMINEHPGEPLTAILPGVTLQELWEITGAAEKTLFAVSVLVVVVGLAGMLVALLTSLSERRREMAVLRSVGARPTHVFALILGEAAVLTMAGIVLGLAALYLGLIAGHGWLESRLGLFVGLGWPSPRELALMALVAAAGVLIGLIPAYRIYRYSLADGMTIRV
jgi:putative ABC transport system permease protein